MRTHIQRRDAALTLVDVLIAIVVIMILGALLLPTLANNNRRPPRIACVSNMKQSSLAFIVWVHDTEKNNLPYRVDWQDEGTRVPGAAKPAWDGLQNNNWFQFSWVEKQLESPKVLVCPSDKKRHVAQNWLATDPAAGFRHANQQNKSLSYDLWMDAGYVNNTLSFENAQEHILISDRHIGYDAVLLGGCSSSVQPIRQVNGRPPSGTVRWRTISDYGHGAGGGLGLLDGSVTSLSQAGLDDFWRRGDDNGSLHYLWPSVAGEP